MKSIVFRVLGVTVLRVAVLIGGLALTSCGTPPGPNGNQQPLTLDAVAERYVKLVLAVGQHDKNYVDAYYGPEAWSQEAETASRTLEEISVEARTLLGRFPSVAADSEELVQLRAAFLKRQLETLAARIGMLGGTWLSFDDESEALYDARAPEHGEEYFQNILTELDRLLADEGAQEGSVIERYDAFRKSFIIPPDKLDAVFRVGIDACRERTAAHIELPEGESFDLEYVTDKTWSAYNWYQGGFRSLIQVNTDLPVYVDRVLDLACHEGYPGHHVYNALLEKHLVKDRGWAEYQVYPLFSPQSLIAEGSANFGIEMAFPGTERLKFERDVLFPLAGLEPQRAAAYNAVRQLVEQLGYAGNEAARNYLDGKWDAEQAAGWLSRYAAMSPARAEQRVGFFDQYRSYVINYNLGLDLVRDYIDATAGVGASPEESWRAFEGLLSSPRLPSGLQGP